MEPETIDDGNSDYGGKGPMTPDATAPSHFPKRLQALPRFEGPFEAFRLAAEGADVLMASYPAGTSIPPHSHDTENCGVITKGELILIVDGEESRFGVGDWYHLPPQKVHAARFEVDTAEIEFWFHMEEGGKGLEVGS